MKSLARSHIWWPKMDADIELCVRNCGMCQDSANMPQASALHPWEWPGRPWFRLHIDYASPIQVKWIFVIVDAHSRYIDTHVSSPSSAVTERMLRRTFATHGSPHVVISDNASSFTCKEFSRFCALNGIKHVRCAPYHPSLNGLVECAVQTIKSGLKKVAGDLEMRSLCVLTRYCLFPQSTTGQSPAMVLMGCQPRSRLDLVYPDLSTQVITKIDNAKRMTDKNRVERMFHIGDTISVVNFQGRPKWLGGDLQEQLGPLTFRVWLEDGRLWKGHVDHIRGNIPTEPVVRGSEESRQPLGSREQTVTRHSTSVVQLPAPYRDSSPSTTGDSLEDEHPRTQMRTCFQKCKEDERRNNAENKAKRQHISMKPDTKGKPPTTMPLTGEIAAQEYPEAMDDVTMSESQTTFPTSNGSSCWSSGEGPRDVSWCH